MRNAGMEETQGGIKIAGRNINHLRYADEETTVRTGHRKMDWFKIRKGVRQGCILSPCLFNFYADYLMRNAGLDESQTESRLLGEISTTSDMQMIPL